MWASAVLLAVVLPTFAKYGVVNKRSYAVSYGGNGQLCNTGLFTSYSDQATCPCGPIILCIGCPTGCCCPTSTPVVYPPPGPPSPAPTHPPVSEGVTSKFLSLATTLSTAVLFFHIV